MYNYYHKKIYKLKDKTLSSLREKNQRERERERKFIS